MRIWISYDMEGVAGVVDWDQCRPGAPGYALGCALLQDEVNAAVDGAVAGGATEVILNDSHGRMANLDPRLVVHPERVRLITGRHKPLYMAQGLDGATDGAFLVGYHGSISGPPSTLSHTYNPEVFAGARLNGVPVGESGINALVADHHGVPIALVTGDRVTRDETAPVAPDAVSVVTKESLTRAAADALAPAEACRLIREAAEAACLSVAAGEVRPPGLPRPSRLELDLQTGDMAEVATWVRGVERTGERQIAIEGEDLLAMYTSFVAATYITRQAGGR